MSIYFTIFTPVYNRKDKIHRVWDSLQTQTYRNFEWIVVNDGSTDNIGSLLEEYQRQADFPVTILTQPNSGKHIAWNRAVEIAKGELFVPADSDDAFAPEALEFFAEQWQMIPIEEKEEYSGINVLCCDSETGQVVGKEFPESPMISNNLELAYKHKITGEKWGCIRVDVLRQRPNPEIAGSHMPESWIWFWLARRYKVLCHNKILRVYYQAEGGALSDKPTYETIQRRSDAAYLYYTWHLSDNIDYLLKYKSKIYVLQRFMALWRASILARKNIISTFTVLKSRKSRILAILTFLPSVVFCSLARLKHLIKK